MVLQVKEIPHRDRHLLPSPTVSACAVCIPNCPVPAGICPHPQPSPQWSSPLPLYYCIFHFRYFRFPTVTAVLPLSPLPCRSLLQVLTVDLSQLCLIWSNIGLAAPSVLWCCWLGSRKGIRPVKTEWWGAGMVICLEQGADLHIAQLMPLLLTVSCFNKIQIGLPFWYRLTRVVPEKGPFDGCVCVLIGSNHHKWDELLHCGPCYLCESFFFFLVSVSGWMFLLVLCWYLVFSIFENIQTKLLN